MMKTAQRYDRAPLQFNPAGGSRIPGRIMRNGLLTYRTADGGTQSEWTPRAVLADAADGFNGAAVTRAHPPAGVTPSNWQDVAVGVVLAPKIVRHSDGYEYVEGLLDITRQDANGAIEQESELSAGYRVVLDQTPGIVPAGEPDAGKPYDAKRVSITPNHVALLPKGRARAGKEARLLIDSIDGAEARLDSLGNQVAAALGETASAHPHAALIAELEKEQTDWRALNKNQAAEDAAFTAKLRELHGKDLPSLVR
ncbi:MAG TPA: DUF2213 domain-containing protein [Polyangiaceae bacterium]|nr:DUF2213 domain-containing protein [Polyangiaceae bacterium]